MVQGWGSIEVKLNERSRPVGSVAGFETYSLDGLIWVGGALQRGEHGGLIVSELTVRRLQAPRGVDANALRRIPLAGIVAEIGGRLSSTYSYLIQADDGGASEAVRASAVPRSQGRPRYPDSHYRRIALQYLKLQEQGISRGVIGQIAESEGRRRETVRDWVATARRLGYLTSQGQGRAGAEPGPRLIEFIDATNQGQITEGKQ